MLIEVGIGKLDRSLSDSVTHALEAARGVTGFYSHQAAAINSIWSGKHVIVSTSTASGKSIIYQVRQFSPSRVIDLLRRLS